ncbi:uncharacterized protein LOC142522042 [Primulina tabacum]|uniref:uncharacterized protein LOC142522042 n=1 Tax=Primulina tabacum TaxID=48773 RepID=UPI003F5A6C0A
MFRRRFRMSRNLFVWIVDGIQNHDVYFIQRSDSLGRLGLSTNQKATGALRMLAYALPADATDEYIQIRESTAIQCMLRFCRAIVEVFAEQYLRSPTANDVARLLYIGKQRGFPGMLGSLDCMHWRWKNCPTAWAGQYAGRSGSPTIILEAVADYDLWIWHAYFGMPGTNNDINVLESSSLFSNLAQGIAPPAHYNIGCTNSRCEGSTDSSALKEPAFAKTMTSRVNEGSTEKRVCERSNKRNINRNKVLNKRGERDEEEDWDASMEEKRRSVARNCTEKNESE